MPKYRDFPMIELPRLSPAHQIIDAAWTERDLLFAVAQMLRNLCAWTVVSGRVPADSMRDIVEISAPQLEDDGVSPAAIAALRTVFEGAVNGDWRRLHRMVNGGKGNGRHPGKPARVEPQREIDI